MTKVIKKTMETKITLHRNGHAESNLFGSLSVHTETGYHAVFTSVENPKYKIEEGTHTLFNGYSPKFGTNLWTVSYPGRSGLRIHPANYGHELLGCIAIGLFRDENQIYQSKKAVSILKTILEPTKDYKITIL